MGQMSEDLTMRECLLRDINDLKRERDEARAELEMWRDGNILHEIHRDELEKVERERDLARNLADAAMWEADRLRSQLWRARDRAWQIACERSRLKSEISNLKSP
jgi:uncharacterized protein (DUF3084 family)